MFDRIAGIAALIVYFTKVFLAWVRSLYAKE